ncbi:MBL fold metallo-hydrolase [Dickeya fangzhongdai]|uniref:MBL fold metallo-hydrolase n=1 Tax=Dickeya fangzhongdai TaxID=1778540 RepID=UPI001ADB71D2|nr:MBL fold metallo-hydrolase [Dickeya fangzhongdai]MBO8134317.1 MBL fold metallo-hydrolase [Dickeya fangzhongdai]
MNITQIRNATLKISFAGKIFLIDPMLAEKGAYPGFEGTLNSHLRNPLVDLPVTLENLFAGVDAVIVTHTHLDHWDDAAKAHLPKSLPIFVQHAQDRETIRATGFGDVRLLTEQSAFGDITLIKTPGQHGSDAIMDALHDRLGDVCGVVFRHPQEKTLYLAGDTVWNADVAENLRRYAPEVIVLNCGDAQIVGLGSIIMNQQDVLAVAQHAPNATLIASHMEAVNHSALSRAALRDFLQQNGVAPQVLIPADGESCML